MTKTLLPIALLLALASTASGQSIAVNPRGVSVNSQAPTTVFLSYGGLAGKIPAESAWCGELESAAPHLGSRCVPSTIFGRLPARYDLSRVGTSGVFTDVMSIPASVARRAYQAAVGGADSRFFYVRRFVDPAGGPDEYVAVTCRLAGGGARVPFALTSVKVAFANDQPVLTVRAGEAVPPITAEIAYNGSGRLSGRWEVVLPNEAPPEKQDLLSEAALPPEERSKQKRFTQLGRFDEFLPPVGRFTIKGPDVSKLPRSIDGAYMVLLRIEATADREADSSFAAVGEAGGVVHSGGIAGFPMPVLRYYVNGPAATKLTATGPFAWTGGVGAAYRVEVEDATSKCILSALLRPTTQTYVPPPWLKGSARWRVSTVDKLGNVMETTEWAPTL